MLISDKHRAVFTAITKTATQSIFRVMEDHYGGYLLAGAEPHSREVPEFARDYHAFTVVRNPYDRAVSCWWSTTQRRNADRYGFRRRCPDPDDFTAFCQWLATDRPDDPLTRTMAEHLAGVRVDSVLRFESLAEDFAKLPFYAGQPEVWPRANQTIDTRKGWRHYMTLDAVEWVNKWCPEDFERFGYQRIEA